MELPQSHPILLAVGRRYQPEIWAAAEMVPGKPAPFGRPVALAGGNSREFPVRRKQFPVSVK
jgi:hypothetical protein